MIGKCGRIFGPTGRVVKATEVDEVKSFCFLEPLQTARHGSTYPDPILAQRPLIAKNAMNGAQLLRLRSHDRATCPAHRDETAMNGPQPEEPKLWLSSMSGPPAWNRFKPLGMTPS